MSYDDTNIFARILRGEIPTDKVFEDDHVLAIRDINPQAPIHILVLPKGKYVSFDDFAAQAGDAEIAGFMRAVHRIAHEAGLAESGYRLIFNHGPDSLREVFHLHAHILGGQMLGPLVARGRNL